MLDWLTAPSHQDSWLLDQYSLKSDSYGQHLKQRTTTQNRNRHPRPISWKEISRESKVLSLSLVQLMAPILWLNWIFVCTLQIKVLQKRTVERDLRKESGGKRAHLSFSSFKNTDSQSKEVTLTHVVGDAEVSTLDNLNMLQRPLISLLY